MSRASSLFQHVLTLWGSCDSLRPRGTSGAAAAAHISLEPGPYFPSYAASPLAAMSGKAPTSSALAARRSRPMAHQQPPAGRAAVNFTPQEFARLKVRTERLEGDNALLRSALEGLAERNKELETRVQSQSEAAQKQQRAQAEGAALRVAELEDLVQQQKTALSDLARTAEGFARENAALSAQVGRLEQDREELSTSGAAMQERLAHLQTTCLALGAASSAAAAAGGGALVADQGTTKGSGQGSGSTPRGMLESATLMVLAKEQQGQRPTAPLEPGRAVAAAGGLPTDLRLALREVAALRKENERLKGRLKKQSSQLEQLQSERRELLQSRAAERRGANIAATQLQSILETTKRRAEHLAELLEDKNELLAEKDNYIQKLELTLLSYSRQPGRQLGAAMEAATAAAAAAAGAHSRGLGGGRSASSAAGSSRGASRAELAGITPMSLTAAVAAAGSSQQQGSRGGGEYGGSPSLAFAAGEWGGAGKEEQWRAGWQGEEGEQEQDGDWCSYQLGASPSASSALPSRSGSAAAQRRPGSGLRTGQRGALRAQHLEERLAAAALAAQQRLAWREGGIGSGGGGGGSRVRALSEPPPLLAQPHSHSERPGQLPAGAARQARSTGAAQLGGRQVHSPASQASHNPLFSLGGPAGVPPSPDIYAAYHFGPDPALGADPAAAAFGGIGGAFEGGDTPVDLPSWVATSPQCLAASLTVLHKNALFQRTPEGKQQLSGGGGGGGSLDADELQLAPAEVEQGIAAYRGRGGGGSGSSLEPARAARQPWRGGEEGEDCEGRLLSPVDLSWPGTASWPASPDRRRALPRGPAQRSLPASPRQPAASRAPAGAAAKPQAPGGVGQVQPRRRQQQQAAKGGSAQAAHQAAARGGAAGATVAVGARAAAGPAGTAATREPAAPHRSGEGRCEESAAALDAGLACLEEPEGFGCVADLLEALTPKSAAAAAAAAVIESGSEGAGAAQQHQGALQQQQQGVPAGGRRQAGKGTQPQQQQQQQFPAAAAKHVEPPNRHEQHRAGSGLGGGKLQALKQGRLNRAADQKLSPAAASRPKGYAARAAAGKQGPARRAG